MNITEIHLKNFKRFSSLQIEAIPKNAKLILLVGANGSGKSSLFDGFNFINGAIKRDVGTGQEFVDYYRKEKNTPAEVHINIGDTAYTISDTNFGQPSLPTTSFYGRTSFRQIPRLTRTTLGSKSTDVNKDSDRPKYFSEADIRFENDVEKITELILKDFFRTPKTKEEVRKAYLDPVNAALNNIFGVSSDNTIQLIEIIPPLEGKVAQLLFRKGKSEFHYNYLSAGEKEVFNLLLNLLARKQNYQDTVYYMDELDLHLNTKNQFDLLKEITENWIPENCQLWTATHSLGFIEYARQAGLAELIDFDHLNFDISQVLQPISKGKPDIYEIAVGKEFLPQLFRDKEIYFVENKDSGFYASVGITNAIFISENNRNNVFHKVRATGYKGIVDRDYLTENDIKVIRDEYKKLFILGYYSIENYMYHPDNLEEFYKSKGEEFDKERYLQELIEAKDEIKDKLSIQIASARMGYPYFGEPIFNGTALQRRFKNHSENFDETEVLKQKLDSNVLEEFYPSLPMKTYCTQLQSRQHAAKIDLVKTNWFREQMRKLLA
jgi:predicted ATP-binding protein involved in virulence